MLHYKKNISVIVLVIFTNFFQAVYANILDDLNHLKNAYPNFIKNVSNDAITWYDNSKMPLGKSSTSTTEQLTNPSLFDQIYNIHYPVGNLTHAVDYPPKTDPGRIRCDAFFKKMYGSSPEEVENKLVTIYWMENIFGKKYPLQVTTVNQIHQKLIDVSTDLAKLPPYFYKYLANPSGGFHWRNIARTHRLSSHSYGISIDLNPQFANYWQWDLENKDMPVYENMPLQYHNKIPWEIVLIFEKHGFIWGGKWYHYDTMHFEYRPELIR